MAKVIRGKGENMTQLFLVDMGVQCIPLILSGHNYGDTFSIHYKSTPSLFSTSKRDMYLSKKHTLPSQGC